MNLDDLTGKMIKAVAGDYGACVRLMIECLELIPFQIPEVGANAITTAKRFWIDRALPGSELDRARVQCWNYLDEWSASTNPEQPDHFALRAIICVLYETPEDIGEVIDCFVQFLRGAFARQNDEEFVAALSSVLEKFFAKT